MMIRLFSIAAFLCLSALPGMAQEAAAPAQDTAFGSTTKIEGSMLGIFYDLKQDQKRQPLPDRDHLRTIGLFLDSGWDERVLSEYFRATKPLYATEVFIPTMSADAAPQAFGLAGVVRPSKWLVIYKAQVSPPEDGIYRFVGIADDVLAVGVNGKTVLVSCYGGHRNYSRWREPAPQENIKVWAGDMRRGNWFTCKKGEIIDLDILISEIPGGLFGGWLFIEKQGDIAPMASDGKNTIPALPVFQVKAKNIPKPLDTKSIPFTISPNPWTCYP